MIRKTSRFQVIAKGVSGAVHMWTTVKYTSSTNMGGRKPPRYAR
jgi:hypothetical protein